MSVRDHNLLSEDPIAGDVDHWIHPDETRTDEQVEYDERYAVEPWDPEKEAKEYDDYVSMEEEYKKPCINAYMLTLEQAVKEHALAQGVRDEDAARISSATFVIKDTDGNPTDTLRANFSYYKGPISRPGVQSFQLHPIDGPKDEYGRDKKYVNGFFGSAHRSTGLGAFSMTYAGGDKAAWQYAHEAMQPETLATADLVELNIPEQQA